MSGRDPGEQHRASTPLELLFDLTFVVAVARAGIELPGLRLVAHQDRLTPRLSIVNPDEYRSGLVGDSGFEPLASTV